MAQTDYRFSDPCPPQPVCPEGVECACEVRGDGTVLLRASDPGDLTYFDLWTLTYNSAGQVVRNEIAMDASVTLVWVYTYDENGRLSDETRWNFDQDHDTPEWVAHHSYDPAGRLARTQSREESWEHPAYTTTTWFDLAGRRVRETVAGGDLPTWGTRRWWAYNDDGNLVREDELENESDYEGYTYDPPCPPPFRGCSEFAADIERPSDFPPAVLGDVCSPFDCPFTGFYRERATCHCDPEGRLMTADGDFNGDGLGDRCSYLSDGPNGSIRACDYSIDGRIDWRAERQHDVEGRIVVRAVDSDADGVPESRDYFTYGEDGNRISVVHHNRDGSSLTCRFEEACPGPWDDAFEADGCDEVCEGE